MLPAHSALVYVGIMGVIALVSRWVLRASPYLGETVDGASNRFLALDGLRGFLATGVFIHHASVYRHYETTGVWREPSDRLLAYLGGDSVNVFFMITGFLFWRKAILRGARIDARDLLRSRVRRVMPAYLIVTSLIILVVFARTDFMLVRPGFEVILAITRWLFGGLLGAPSINGANMPLVNCGVTWTLQYEWCFYLALPLLAPFATTRRAPLLFGLVLLMAIALRLLRVEPPFSLGSVARFLMGMLVAHASVRYPELTRLRSPWISAGLGLLLTSLVLLPVPRAAVALVLWAVFASVIYGNDYFGLLTSRWMTLLGHASYSIYLMHGLVLSVALGVIGRVTTVSTLTEAQYWLLVAAISGVMLVSSLMLYRVGEAPFLMERAVSRSIPNPSPRSKPAAQDQAQA